MKAKLGRYAVPFIPRHIFEKLRSLGSQGCTQSAVAYLQRYPEALLWCKWMMAGDNCQKAFARYNTPGTEAAAAPTQAPVIYNSGIAGRVKRRRGNNKP